jgi:hypothetical protein
MNPLGCSDATNYCTPQTASSITNATNPKYKRSTTGDSIKQTTCMREVTYHFFFSLSPATLMTHWPGRSPFDESPNKYTFLLINKCSVCFFTTLSASASHRRISTAREKMGVRVCRLLLLNTVNTHSRLVTYYICISVN